ncbi:MAG TPA: pirin family protein [Pyrinomonadaceae bacterium]|nr:pirin family protein [Pyrinomonadaceae bacterium]
MRGVERIITASESVLPGEFVVRRALPRRELRRVGGFVFLDHFDEQNVTPEKFDVPPHPHIGLQTVSYLFEGEILHRDSLDYEQLISPGDVNLMTSGRGIAHSEQVAKTQERLHGLQIWIGLPHDKRKIEPAFENFPRDGFPIVNFGETSVKVIFGELERSTSPIKTHQKLVYFDINSPNGGDVTLPCDENDELAIYVTDGEVVVDGQSAKRFDLVQLSAGDSVELSLAEASRCVLIGGEPLPEPTVIYWNFIADSMDEAKQAMSDWESGKFPVVNKYRKIV